MEDVSHPHEHSAGTECDQNTDNHYHSHGDRPLVEVEPEGRGGIRWGGGNKGVLSQSLRWATGRGRT